jgi:Ser/Thr protein kinase RdoA (MazF antagonist)
MHMQEKIILIFKNHLREEVLRISDSSRGNEQQVFIVETDRGMRVIKFPPTRDPGMAAREAYACTLLRGKIPVPEIVIRGDGFLIETFLPGEMLSEAQLTEEEQELVYAALGRAVRIMHTVEAEGYGEMQSHRKGLHAKLGRHIGHVSRQHLPPLGDTGLLSDRETALLVSSIKRGWERVGDESVLLHFDLLDTNVLTEAGRLTGLIDFGDLSCGPRAYDLAKFYIEKEATPHLAHFLSGYGETDIGEIEYFALLHLLYELPYYHAGGNMEKTVSLTALLRRLLAI